MNDYQKPTSQRNRLLLLGGCLLVVLCLVAGGMALLLGYFVLDGESQVAQSELDPAVVVVPTETAFPPTPFPPTATADAAPTATAAESLATAVPTPIALSILPPAAVEQRPVPDRAATDLERLFETEYPALDYYATAVTLGRYDLGKRQFERPPAQLGAVESFITDNGPIDATLVAVTDHTYFWVENGLRVDETAVQTIAQRLEQDYLLLTRLFGQEWKPGIDGDPRFSVLHLAGSGDIYELGYFTDLDEYPRTLFAESNEREIIYLNMGQLVLGSDLYYGTLVHELQHLIQWHLDKNEATWLNEGLSQLAELQVGLLTAETTPFSEQPGVQLNTWEYEDHVIDAHYAASYLFTVYLWEKLGEAALTELVRHPANGLAAVRKVLQGHRPAQSLEDFMGSWAVANLLDDPAAGADYAYFSLDLERPYLETRVRHRPFDEVLSANPFGAHYIDLDFSGPTTITFAGDTIAELVGTSPRSGSQMWLVPPSNDTDARLTGSFDLSNVISATLEFSSWYDLEQDYDFAYISISTDGGQSWSLLYPERGVAGDFGPAFNGRSADAPSANSGWIQESIPLDAYVGGPVQIRFQVLTDFENALGGFALDDIAIPEIGYFDDVESDSGRWQAQGFVATGWLLPQKWAVRLIQHGPTPQVIPLSLDAFNRVQQTVELGTDGGTLVVMPVTDFVNGPAEYWLRVE